METETVMEIGVGERPRSVEVARHARYIDAANAAYSASTYHARVVAGVAPGHEPPDTERYDAAHAEVFAAAFAAALCSADPISAACSAAAEMAQALLVEVPAPPPDGVAR